MLPIQAKCITTAAANDFSPIHWQEGSVTHLNSSAWLKILQTTFLLLIRKREVLPTQTQVHYFRCCKKLFSFPLLKGKLYPPKLFCMTSDITNDFFSCLFSWGKSYIPKLNICLPMLQRTFLVHISKVVLLPIRREAHEMTCCKKTFLMPIRKEES